MKKHLEHIPKRLWPAVMKAARRRFVAGNAFGVRAFGIGPRVRCGQETARHTLNVYVRRKLVRPEAAVPAFDVVASGKRFRVRPNVIATGVLPKAAQGGNADYSGVHAGAVISIRGNTPGRGAIAATVGAGDQPTHILTAGHLFEPNTRARVFAAPASGQTAVAIAEVIANFLDVDDCDAALLELTSAGRDMVTSAGPLLVDFLSERSVWDKDVRAFLPAANDFSRTVATTSGPMDALMSAPTRGDFWVRDAVGTSGALTSSGDSGTVLCAGVDNDLAVGLCSGALVAHSVFEPFWRALERASDNLNSALTLF